MDTPCPSPAPDTPQTYTESDIGQWRERPCAICHEPIPDTQHLCRGCKNEQSALFPFARLT